jgi:hypothetical protein
LLLRGLLLGLLAGVLALLVVADRSGGTGDHRGRRRHTDQSGASSSSHHRMCSSNPLRG